MSEEKSFLSPYEVAAPAGAEDWKSIYPYYLQFLESRREEEEGKFWFADTLHWPTVFRPFEVTTVEMAIKVLGQMNTRHYIVPPANGIDFRILNGYVYMSPVAVNPEEIPARAEEFMERAGHYFQNWPSLLENWHVKVAKLISDMEALEFSALPERVSMETITSGLGQAPTVDMFKNYDRLIQLAFEGWQYHFEFLNLGYIGFLDFFGFCKEAFPDIPDLAISKMVQGMDAELYRPDDELRKLSKLAVELGLESSFNDSDPLASIAATANGVQWLTAWDSARDPWFNVSDGSGMYASDNWWRDNFSIPLGFIKDYIVKLKAGESIDRPMEELLAERDRIVSEYAASLDDETREAFEGKLGLARLVFPYTEGHTFFIDHWMNGVFWRKIRELSSVLTEAGFFKEVDDIFYLTRYEVPEVLFDYSMGWSVGAPSTGTFYWPDEIERRRAIVDALKQETPPPALNSPPEIITEPFTIMLYGITSESVKSWLNDEESNIIKGMAASSGVVEGIARVIRSAAELDTIQEGEILVAPITSPTWGPVFSKIKATVTDIGGMMSHAAIVCREYGLPAVTATGIASNTIKSGQRIKVDGSNGTVEILD